MASTNKTLERKFTSHRSDARVESSIEIAKESRLWRSVLSQAIHDIYGSDDAARREVIRWLKSKDFSIVCDYSYVHPDTMREQLTALLDLPLSLARKYGDILREKVVKDI